MVLLHVNVPQVGAALVVGSGPFPGDEGKDSDDAQDAAGSTSSVQYVCMWAPVVTMR